MDVNQIYFIGHNKYGQAGIGQDEHNKKYPQPKQIVFRTFIKQVSCGNHHSVLLTIDGLIYTMGSNIHGTLGLGNSGNINYAFRPTLVKELKDVDQVVSGSYHMCAIKQGELYSWGKGIDGQLGHGNMKNVFVPTKVQTLGKDVESVSCGMNHTLVTVNKSINNNNMNGYAFGSGIYGQLGCGSNRSYNYPVNIKLPNIQSVSAGENHSLFISQGKVYGCGDNSSFQIAGFQDSYKNKKYILEPIKVDFFADGEVSFVDCHLLSAALMTNGKSYVWGGKLKIWPPVCLDEEEIINLQVTSEKIYCINGGNQLVSISFKNSPKFSQQKEIVLKNSSILDFDAGEHHMLAVGDIVAQTDDKQEASILQLWTGESLASSKQSFSQKNLNQKSEGSLLTIKDPIHKKMPDFFFTRHLQSGMTEEESSNNESSQISHQNTMYFRTVSQSSQNSVEHQTSIMETNTHENISSEIETESKPTFEINESEHRQYTGDKSFIKLENKVQVSEQKAQQICIEKEISTVLQDKRYSQNKLQKLMDEMEIKTVHLKKKYPLEDKENQQKRINKTPSSYIKKEPENFVLESQQTNKLKPISSHPQISNFEENLQAAFPLRQIQNQNSSISCHNKSREIQKSKNRAKSIIYYNQKQSPQQQEHQVSGFFKQPNDVIEKQQGLSIEEIFVQLLKKQKREKASHEKTPKAPPNRVNEEIRKRSQGRSHSCVESKLTEPSTSRFEKEELEISELPKLVPINSMRTPINESKLKVSKISDNSNISGKSNLRRNPDIMEITRSNRELRFQLRDRDLKISHLQEDLSKKDIELEMLYKQLDYFKNLCVSCHQCGASTSVQDPFRSI